MRCARSTRQSLRVPHGICTRWLLRLRVGDCHRSDCVVPRRLTTKPLTGRARRPLPTGLGAPSNGPEAPLTPAPAVPWLQPFPDARMDLDVRADIRLAWWRRCRPCRRVNEPSWCSVRCWSSARPRSPCSWTCRCRRSTAPWLAPRCRAPAVSATCGNRTMPKSAGRPGRATTRPPTTPDGQRCQRPHRREDASRTGPCRDRHDRTSWKGRYRREPNRAGSALAGTPPHA